MSDYLWDKTGEPDEEVARLEQLLGTLAHEARAPELPAAARVARVEHAAPFFRRRLTRPAFAFAAALALMLLAGAWLALSRRAPRTGPTPALSGNVHNPAVIRHKPKIMQPPVHNGTGAGERVSRQPRARATRSNVAAATKKRRVVAGRGQGAREELASALTGREQSAKEQLVYALRLTGAKLSEVQTKVRGTPEARPAPGAQSNRIR